MTAVDGRIENRGVDQQANSGLTINCEDYFPRWQTQLFKIGQIQRNVSAPTRSGELRAGTCHQHRVGWGEVPTTEFPK
jgi:hypothetical protein